MNKKIQISIPQPCQEGWQNMTPVEKGRFCASCQKTVLNFTYLSDNEIINLVNKNDALCGRISTSQLNRNLIETKRTSNYFGYLATSVLAFLGLGIPNVVAQEKPSVVQTDSKVLDKFIPNTRKIKVFGLVTDIYGKPLHGASVSIKDSKKQVFTDVNGKFSINVKRNKFLIFNSSGYEDEIIIANSTEINLQFKKEKIELMGMMVIEVD